MASSPALSQEDPVLCLRMKSSCGELVPPQATIESYEHRDTLVDFLHVMMCQETSTYKCRDYLRRSNRHKNTKKLILSAGDKSKHNDLLILDEVDILCREKMCEWSYRVVDHFRVNREVVAVAFSYLDRFMDQCTSIDKSAFKLAAMATLHMATKIISSNKAEILMSNLAELSRGEFDIAHIIKMESIVIDALHWRMHPPTVQSFIYYLIELLPQQNQGKTLSSISIRAIFQRASFFAELLVFDYEVVTTSRSALALAAMMNAMEGMNDNVLSELDQFKFLDTLGTQIGLDVPAATLDYTRKRLWYLYSQSTQYQDDGILLQRKQKLQQERQQEHSPQKAAGTFNSSGSITTDRGDSPPDHSKADKQQGRTSQKNLSPTSVLL